MKDSSLLKLVKEYLQQIHHSPPHCICPAIRLADNRRIFNGDAEHKREKQHQRLRWWIASMLPTGEWVRLDHWLAQQGHIPKALFVSEMYDDQTLIRLKATRLAWLDWMIAECEKAEAQEELS